MRRRVLIFLLFFLPACRAEAQAPSRAATTSTSLCELIATASTMALVCGARPEPPSHHDRLRSERKPSRHANA